MQIVSTNQPGIILEESQSGKAAALAMTKTPIAGILLRSSATVASPMKHLSLPDTPDCFSSDRPSSVHWIDSLAPHHSHLKTKRQADCGEGGADSRSEGVTISIGAS